MKCKRIRWISAKKLDEIEANAKIISKDDAEEGWEETVGIHTYDVFVHGINVVPLLVKEIRKLRSALDLDQAAKP